MSDTNERRRYTAADVEAEVAGSMREEIAAELRDGAARGETCPAFLKPLFEAGHWLGSKLFEEGATPEEEESATFALGQRIMMRGVPRAYEEAVAALERFRAGRPDRGGLELGNRLIDERVGR